MPSERSKALSFTSWPELLRQLPHARESQLLTVFVWAGDQAKVPADDARYLAEVRREAFEQLVSRTREPLRRYLERRQRCRDAHLADDVIQEVFIQLYRRAEQYDPEKSFWGWLYRIAHNKYIDALRRAKPGDRGTGDEGNDGWPREHLSPGPAPDAALLEDERRRRLDAAIERLPAVQRDIVRRKIDGAQGKEIAREIGKSQAYVSQAYHEALEWVRDQIDD